METEDSFIASDNQMETDVLFPFHNIPEVVLKDLPRNQLKESELLEMSKQLLTKCRFGLIDDVKELMSRGAPFAADWLGTSPLHLTAYYNHPQLTQFLLASGITKDARNKADRTPLHIAAQMGHIEVLKVLLAYGCDVNIRDMLRMTPLHWAAESGSFECTQLLLDFGAEISVYNKFDKSPCMIAQEHNDNDIVKLLEETRIIPSTVRTAKHQEVKKKALAELSKASKEIQEPLKIKYAPIKEVGMRVIRKKQKIGVLVTKEDLLEGRISDLGHSDESHEDFENDKPIITDSLLDTNKLGGNLPQKSQGNRFNSQDKALLLSDSGKLLLTRPLMLTLLKKDGVNGCREIKNVEIPLATTAKYPPPKSSPPPNLSPLLQSPPPPPPSPPSLNTKKKIISIKAEQLISMAKEKKFIIKPSTGSSFPKARMFEGKVYSVEKKDELLEKVRERLNEKQKAVDLLRQQLEKKEKEVENYKKQLEAISSWSQ